MSDQAFHDAAEKVKKLKARPTDSELLEVYGLFKQATLGDCNTAKPGMFDLKAKAKWENWNSKKGMSKDEATRKYVELVNKLVSQYGTN